MDRFNTFSRRQILLGASAALAALAVPRIATAFAIGDKQLMTLSDGNLVLPMGFAYPNAPQDELMAMLKAANLSTEALVPDCNVTLMRDGDRVVLFDVGAGANFQPTAGKLLASLEAAGVAPDDITDVLFTHAHPDHLWGLLDEFDELVFANAQYRMSKPEWDYWRADDTLAAMPEERKTFVVGAQSRLEVLADRIQLFDFGSEVLPGVEAVDTRGHTPGHTSFAVHSGSDNVMIIGDAVSNVPISFARPGWPSGSDQDAQMGADARVKLMDRLTADNSQIIGYHFPHPGAGRVERDGTAYRYEAMPA